MSIDPTGSLSQEAAAEPTSVSPESGVASVTSSPSSPPSSPPEPSWNRRGFLRAAALGAAVAGSLLLDRDKAGRLHLGGAAALADNLSHLQCTANDVRVIGPGIVLNEACACTGTFNALVEFEVENNAASERYCLTLHLCAATLADGTVFPARDLVLNNGNPIPAKSKAKYTTTIPGYPCGAGLVCFGAQGPEEFGVFPKGAPCPAGQCCSTITYNVKASDPCPDTTRQIGSKCRHQQICIVGRGSATLDCDPTTVTVNHTCDVPCGSKATLLLCTTSSAGLGPFLFELSDGQKFGPTANTCHSFTVGPITEDATFTGTVTEKDGCKKSDSVTLTTTSIAPVISVDKSACNGVLTISCSVPGFTGCTFAYKIDGEAATNTATDTLLVRVNSDGTLSYRNLDGKCHTIGVTATCGGCSGVASTTVKQACVDTTTGCTP